MISSAQSGNPLPWVDHTESTDRAEKLLEDAFSSFSFASTVGTNGSRPPALSVSSLSTLEEEAHRGDPLGITSGLTPPSPTTSAKSRGSNFIGTPLQSEDVDGQNNISSPITSDQISFDFPTSDSFLPFVKERPRNAAPEADNMNKADVGNSFGNSSSFDIRAVKSDVTGSHVSMYETSPTTYNEEARGFPTARSNFSQIDKMGSVDEHEQFVISNRVRAESLGYPTRSSSNLGDAEIPSGSWHEHGRRSSMPDFEGLQNQQLPPPQFNGQYNQPYNDNSALQHSRSHDHLQDTSRGMAFNDFGSRQRNHLPNDHTEGALRQRVMSADDQFQRGHHRYQQHNLEPLMSISHRPKVQPPPRTLNYDGVNANYNFDMHSNRPRSYSSSTNAVDYERGQQFRVQDQHHLAPRHQHMNSQILRHSSQGNLMEHVSGNEVGGSDFGMPPQFYPGNVGSVDAGMYLSGSLGSTHSRDAPQSVETVQRNTIHRVSSYSHDYPHNLDPSASYGGNITRSLSSGAYDVHDPAMNNSNNGKHFPLMDPLSRYKSKETAPGARAAGSPKFVYTIKFKRTQRNFVVAPRLQREVNIGCYVKVEADRGEDLGIVIGCIPAAKFNINLKSSDTGDAADSALPPNGNIGDLKRVLRLATHDEVSLLARKKEEEDELLKICLTKIHQRGLPMNVVDAEYQFDRNKLTFFFQAEGRVDFRELVRDLFSIYKTRIWMQQLDKNNLGENGNNCSENVSRNDESFVGSENNFDNSQDIGA